eukprot:928050_1
MAQQVHKKGRNDDGNPINRDDYKKKEKECHVEIAQTKTRPKRGHSKPSKARTQNQLQAIKRAHNTSIYTMKNIDPVHVDRFVILHEDNLLKLKNAMKKAKVEGRINANGDFVNKIVEQADFDTKKALQFALSLHANEEKEYENNKNQQIGDLNIDIKGLGGVYTKNGVIAEILSAKWWCELRPELAYLPSLISLELGRMKRNGYEWVFSIDNFNRGVGKQIKDEQMPLPMEIVSLNKKRQITLIFRSKYRLYENRFE